jgi:hypothetical protein
MSGNGVDIGAVYQLLTKVAETLAGHDLKLDSIDRRLDGVEGRLDGVERRLGVVERRLDGVDHRRSDGRASRPSPGSYRVSRVVLGHGILISELEERVRRIELHLNVPPVT